MLVFFHVMQQYLSWFGDICPQSSLSSEDLAFSWRWSTLSEGISDCRYLCSTHGERGRERVLLLQEWPCAWKKPLYLSPAQGEGLQAGKPSLGVPGGTGQTEEGHGNWNPAAITGPPGTQVEVPFCEFQYKTPVKSKVVGMGSPSCVFNWCLSSLLLPWGSLSKCFKACWVFWNGTRWHHADAK